MAFVALVSMTSCKKDQSLVKNENIKDPVSLKNGMLVFRDTLVFREYYSKSLIPNGLKNDKLAENFVSYKEIFDKAQEEFSNVSNQSQLELFLAKNSDNIIFNNKDMSLQSKYCNPIFMKFINSEGRFMIGNQLQIMTKSKYIIIDNPTEDKINIALSNNSSGVHQDISIRSKIQASNNKSVQQSVTGVVPTGMINEVTYYNEDGKRRLFVQTWNEYNPAYGKYHLYVSMFQQKKGTFGGWSNNQTDHYFNGLIATGVAYYGIPVIDATQYASPVLSYSWQNVTGPVSYELPIAIGSTEPKGRYEYLRTLDLTGHFFSGGVPNTPTYQLSYY